VSHLPIFVAGTSRSGTTLTSKILSLHSQILAPGSMEFLKDIYAVREQMRGGIPEAAARETILAQVRAFYSRRNDLAEQARVEDIFLNMDIATRILSARSTLEMSKLLLDSQTTRAGKTCWVRHAPGGIIYDLPNLFSLFPDAKVILCVRNPLDYLVSYRDSFKRAERRNRVHEVDRLQKLYHPIVTSLLWVASVRVVSRALEHYASRVFLSRYEDLVADPEIQVRRLCAFIGVEFESAMLAVEGNNSSESVNRGGIFATSVGRWRDTLPEADAFISQLICGREMRSLGYTSVPLRADVAQISWRVITTPFFAWRALSANRSQRTSTMAYLAKRVSAFFFHRGRSTPVDDVPRMTRDA
jgi:hypothetical protein